MRPLTALAPIAFLLLVAAPPSPAQSPAGEAGAEAAEASEPDEEPERVEGRSLAEWYELGGWVMHVLVGMSIMSLAVVLERSTMLRRRRTFPSRFLALFRERARDGDARGALELCTDSDCSLARVLRPGLVRFERGPIEMAEAAATAIEQESGELRRNLPLLAALGNMATMLGLLGTVLGMIESFDLIARIGTGDARVVAGGIFQALVTTAAGLMVGLFAVGAHSLLRRRAEAIEVELGEKASRMLEDLWIGSATAAPAPGADREPAAEG